MTAAEIAAVTTAAVSLAAALTAYLRARVAHQAVKALARLQAGNAVPTVRRTQGSRYDDDRR